MIALGVPYVALGNVHGDSGFIEILEPLQYMHKTHGVKSMIYVDKYFENELVEDILSLMASFSAKIYGKRSHQNSKKKNK